MSALQNPDVVGGIFGKRECSLGMVAGPILHSCIELYFMAIQFHKQFVSMTACNYSNNHSYDYLP